MMMERLLLHIPITLNAFCFAHNTPIVLRRDARLCLNFLILFCAQFVIMRVLWSFPISNNAPFCLLSFVTRRCSNGALKKACLEYIHGFARSTRSTNDSCEIVALSEKSVKIQFIPPISSSLHLFIVIRYLVKSAMWFKRVLTVDLCAVVVSFWMPSSRAEWEKRPDRLTASVCSYHFFPISHFCRPSHFFSVAHHP